MKRAVLKNKYLFSYKKTLFTIDKMRFISSFLNRQKFVKLGDAHLWKSAPAGMFVTNASLPTF